MLLSVMVSAPINQNVAAIIHNVHVATLRDGKAMAEEVAVMDKGPIGLEVQVGVLNTCRTRSTMQQGQGQVCQSRHWYYHVGTMS